MSKTRQVFAVNWFDAAGATEWVDESEAADMNPPLCTTVGFILSKTKRKLVIVSTVGHGEDGQVGGREVIPAGMVQSIKSLGVIVIEEAKAKKTRP